jgi:hypothetical protein
LLIVYVYLTQVLTKFHCPKWKTFVLARFLRDRIKFSEVPEEPHGIPVEA